jgi:hypothetical protein
MSGGETLEGVIVRYAYNTLTAQRLARMDHRQNEGAYNTPRPSYPPNSCITYRFKDRLQA